MDIQEIIQLLQNAGFNVKGLDSSSTYLIIESPSCIVSSFETFLNYAWIIIVFITGVLVFGWAISLIRGAKTDIIKNARNLILIFGTLGATIPIVNVIYGSDIREYTCKNIKVSVDDINKLLDLRKAKMSVSDDLYERIDINFSDGDLNDEFNFDDLPEAVSVSEETPEP